MNLSILFSPVPESCYSSITPSSSFFKSIKVFGDKMPDYKEAHVAILGIPEGRGAGENNGTAKSPNAIREKLYRLKKGTGAYRVVDLGNLNPGHDLEETYVRLSEVCNILLEHNVLPLIIGGSQDLDFGQYTGYERMEKLVSVVNIDATLDVEGNTEHHKHINRMLLHEPNFLFAYTHLAHQTYLIDPGSLAILEKLYFEAFRVGQMRANLQEMEPAIRNADMMSFDIGAIRSADAPGNQNAQPFGLTGEEACQICWYAGLSEKLSSVGFYEYNPDADDDSRKTASVVATMVWYFIEGYYHRKQHQNFKSNDFLKYVVALPSDPETIIFYKSKFSEKWWMEIPFPAGMERYSRNSIVPCSYKDYQAATKGEVPERYISTLVKLM